MRGLRILALLLVPVLTACAKKPAKSDDAPAPSEPSQPAPAPAPAPAAALPSPAPAPAAPAGPALPLPFLQELALSKVFSLEAPSSVQGLGVAPELPSDEGMMLTEGAPRSRDACTARQAIGAPMAQLRALAAKLCAIEAVAERLERGKRYASVPAIGFGVYVDKDAATIRLCDGGAPYATVTVADGTHGRVKGTLKLASGARTLAGTFDNGVSEAGRTVFDLAATDGTARYRARASLAAGGVSELSYSVASPARVKLAARIDATKGALVARHYAESLASGEEARATFDANGALADVEALEVPASLLLPLPGSLVPATFGDGDWACDGETYDFSMTTQEFTAYDVCDLTSGTPFVPAETCTADAYEAVPRAAFTCSPASPEGC